MKRKLASVRVVEEILPIVGADAIEAVRLGGWACVVRKGAFQVGDQGVYFEIDAVLPDSEAFRFLWTPKGEVQRAGLRPPSFRLRTKKLRGCLSQGLFMRFDELGLTGVHETGQDLTELLGVEKWDPPLPTGAGDTRGAFPAAVPKTDEMRVPPKADAATRMTRAFFEKTAEGPVWTFDRLGTSHSVGARRAR